jgi:plastocyanin
LPGSVFRIEWKVLIAHETLDWDLWYSTTGENGPWIPVAQDLPAGDIAAGVVHTFLWTVPDAQSDEVRVRVRQDNFYTDYEDISDANLTIGDVQPECTDFDGDGYGAPGNVVCPGGPEEDCNDFDPDSNPGTAEICDDGIDNDCDQTTDQLDLDCAVGTIVQQVDLTFQPADVLVTPGDTVEWVHTDGVHTVTSGSECMPDGRFDLLLDGTVSPVAYMVPEDEPYGVIPYFCIPHCALAMTGTITVVECLDGSHCDDGNVCTANLCVDNACQNTAVPYGDVDFNDAVTMLDIFCVLDGIAGDFDTCKFEDMDIHPCEGDEALNLLDVFAILNAIAGEDPCCAGS